MNIAHGTIHVADDNTALCGAQRVPLCSIEAFKTTHHPKCPDCQGLVELMSTPLKERLGGSIFGDYVPTGIAPRLADPPEPPPPGHEGQWQGHMRSIPEVDFDLYITNGYADGLLINRDSHFYPKAFAVVVTGWTGGKDVLNEQGRIVRTREEDILGRSVRLTLAISQKFQETQETTLVSEHAPVLLTEFKGRSYPGPELFRPLHGPHVVATRQGYGVHLEGLPEGMSGFVRLRGTLVTP